MITGFRSFFASTFGRVAAFLLLALIAVAFVTADMSGTGGLGGGGAGSAASVGDEEIGVGEVRELVRRAYAAAQAQQPGLTMAEYVEQGALDNALNSLIDGAAFRQYAAEMGFAPSKRLVDAKIAELPIFSGASGKFEQRLYDEFLQREGLSDRQVRADIVRQLLRDHIERPVAILPGIAPALALPYTALLLERRRGSAVFVAAAPLAPTAAPTEAVLAAHLSQNRARFSLPEQRVLRYATFDRAGVAAPEPTAAEIAQIYKDNAARFAASESRRFNRVIAPDQAVARRIAEAVRGGTSLDAAARAAGLATAFTQSLPRAEFAAEAGDAVAAEGFGAARGALIGPVKQDLGWAVLVLDSITVQPALTLAQATPQIRQQLAERKREEALQTKFNAIQDALNDGVGLDEVAGDHKLTIAETPALATDGRARRQPAFALPANAAPILTAGFQALEGGETQLVTLAENDSFAVVETKQIMAAAPPPLAEIRADLAADWRLSEGHRAARDKARAIAKDAEAKKSLATAAAAAAGPALGTVQQIGGTRGELTREQGRLPPEVALLFSMAKGSVKTLEMPGNRGWLVVSLDETDRPASNAIPVPQTAAIAAPLASAMGGELVDQMTADARQRVGVRINQALIDQLRAELSGTAAQPGG